MTNTFILSEMPTNRTAHLPQDVIHSNYPVENDSLFVVNIVNVVGFVWGFPSVLIMNTFVLILDLKCLSKTMKGSDFYVPSPFIAIFHMMRLFKSA